MTHVVTARCHECRYTDCIEACPVECFIEVQDPAMLVIDPEVCIDCTQCVPECPVNAIYDEEELPAHYAEWTELNREMVSMGATITQKKDPHPKHVDLEGVQKRETDAGWDPAEPANA